MKTESRVAIRERPSLPTAYTDQRHRKVVHRSIAELCVESGYRSVDIQAIVKRARIARATLYRLFAGKEVAFRSMIKTGVQEAVEVAGGAEGVEVAERLRSQLGALVKFARQNPSLVQAILIDGPILTNVYVAETDRIVAMVDLPEKKARLLLGGVEWTMRQRLLAKKPIDGALLTELCAFVIPYFDESAELPEIPDAVIDKAPAAWPATAYLIADDGFSLGLDEAERRRAEAEHHDVETYRPDALLKEVLDAAELYHRLGNSRTSSVLLKAIAKGRAKLGSKTPPREPSESS